MSESSTHASFIAPSAAELAPLFPGYEIECLIATGGMGAVYAAVQKSLDRSVAIKILPPELSADANFREGFQAEAKAMARLNHPNLIGVYDSGEVSGMLYIIMEFVPGQSLFHSSHGIAIDPTEVIRIVSGICSGLAHAHDNGIIHRDIKPANILLDLNANPKIGDFGLARPADRQIQEGEEIFGTPHYTAPEVVSSPQAVDHRADIFSLGVILHELLTGCLPADDPRTASAISYCDPRFDAIIRRATDPYPAHRYSSAHEIERDLHTIATSAGPRALKTAAHASPSRIKRKAIRQSSGNPALVFIIIAALAGGAAYLILSDKKQPAARPAVEGTNPAPPPTQEPEKPIAETKEKSPPPAPVEPVIPGALAAEHPEPAAGQISEPAPSSGEEPAVVEPKFDIPAFLERARGIMRERAAPLIQSHNQGLAKNTADYGVSLTWEAKKITHKPTRDSVLKGVDEFIRKCKTEHNRIPAEPSESLTNLVGQDGIHEQFLKQQQAYEKNLADGLSSLSTVYILGIEKQIERLRAQDDPGAIRLLEDEIQSVREDTGYFSELIIPGE
jgi:serine/threonine protein kinase